MQRRTFIAGAGALTIASIGTGRLLMAAHKTDTVAQTTAEFTPLNVDHDAWKSLVSDDAWGVLFQENTERAGSSPLNNEKRNGTFVCAACYLPLFASKWKYDSGTGWPSFFEKIDGHFGFKEDNRLFSTRTEYHCARCGGHQGHVFKDGPEPTGLRYCNNGLALKFVPEQDDLPELRSP